jgi:hypothetical protein
LARISAETSPNRSSTSLPFASIAAIELPDPHAPARELAPSQSGEVLTLELARDLRDKNGGLLVFAAGAEYAEYVPCREAAKVEVDRTAYR